MESFPLLGQCPQPRKTHVDRCKSTAELELLGGQKLRQNLTHTKCVNEEMVLNFVYIPVTGSVPWQRVEFYGIIQEIHLPTDQAAVTKCFQYPMSSRGGFSESVSNIWGEGVTCLPRHNPIVALSICCML
jgi:hypothetical protein